MDFIELIFLVPLITAVGWFIVTNLFMGGLMDGDADADFDADLEVEAGGDSGLDTEASMVDASAEADVGIDFSWLGYLGFKKVPFVLWLQILGMIWGTTGLVLLMWFDLFILRAAIAGTATVLGTGSICAVLARVMPRTESDLMTDRQMLGMIGAVVTSTVTNTFGQAGFNSKLGYMTREVRVSEGTDDLSQNEVVIVVGDQDGALLVQREADLLGN